MEGGIGDGKVGICVLCGWYGNLTVHHTLWPRAKWVRHPMREVLKVHICRECHDLIHRHYYETQYSDPNRR